MRGSKRRRSAHTRELQAYDGPKKRYKYKTAKASSAREANKLYAPTMTTLAPRLATLNGTRIAFLRNKKLGSEKFCSTLEHTLQSSHAIETKTWVKASPYQPLSAKRRAEITAWADGVVACPGDCAHGSSVLRFDIFEFEAACRPVAWVDTPRRMPRVTKRDGAFEIDYALPGDRRPIVRGRHEERDVAKRGGFASEAARAIAIKNMEKWGLHRALRVAGAKPGDRVRIRKREFELWDYPPPLLPSTWDGPAEYAYVEIPSLRNTDDAVLAAWAVERAPAVAQLLLRGS